MREWLRKLMYGRYGGDQLTLALLIFSIVLSFIGSIFRWYILNWISYIPLIYAVYRIFSKNITKRARENEKFNQRIYRVRGWFTGGKQRRAQKKQYRFYTCPNCKKKLRVPRGKGKIQITCPMCNHQFVKKT